MSEEKWHRLPADEIGLLIGKDANATVFPPTESPFAKGRWYNWADMRQKVGRDVLGAPLEVRGGSNRNEVEMAQRQRPRPT